YAHNAAVALSPDGSLLAYAGGGEDESRVLVRDVRAGRDLGEWTLRPGGYERLAGPSPDRFLLVREQFVGGTQAVETVAWEVRAGRLVLRERFPDGPTGRELGAHLGDDGKSLWVATPTSEPVRYDLGTGRVAGRVGDLPAAVTPGGGVLFAVPHRALTHSPG